MGFELLNFLRKQGGIKRTGRYHLSPLRGGYWNQVYRLQGEEVDWVAKVYAAERPQTLFPILPESEALSLKALSGRGIAPDFVKFYPAVDNQNPDLLLYQFVPGKTWSAETRSVARLMRKLHGVDTGPFSSLRKLATTPEQLLTAGDLLLRDLTDSPDAGRLRGRRPAIKSVPPLDNLRLIHGDSGTGNLIVSAHGPILIDWQCPGLGDPVEDLNCFLSPVFQSLYNHPPLSNAEIAAFFEAYDEQRVIERYQALQPYYGYRMAAHCCLQSIRRQKTDPASSAAYANALDIALARL